MVLEFKKDDQGKGKKKGEGSLSCLELVQSVLSREECSGAEETACAKALG